MKMRATLLILALAFTSVGIGCGDSKAIPARTDGGAGKGGSGGAGGSGGVGGAGGHAGAGGVGGSSDGGGAGTTGGVDASEGGNDAEHDATDAAPSEGGDGAATDTAHEDGATAG